VNSEKHMLKNHEKNEDIYLNDTLFGMKGVTRKNRREKGTRETQIA